MENSTLFSKADGAEKLIVGRKKFRTLTTNYQQNTLQLNQ